MNLSFAAMETGSTESGDEVRENEAIIDYTNGALTKFLIKLSENASQSDERIIGSYFHVLNDLERVADHLVNVGYSIINPIGSEKEDLM